MLIKKIIAVTAFLFLTSTVYAFFNFNQLKKNDLQTLQELIQGLKTKNVYFKKLYHELEASDRQFTITIRSSRHLAFFSPNQQGGSINFSNSNILQDENAVIEEFFHAFQHIFYKLPVHLKRGGSNIEYEAKLFRAIILIEQGLPMNETPSQKGLLNFVLEVLDEQGRFRLKQFSKQQRKKYIQCVRHFQQHWIERNQNENQKNIYTQEVVESWMPKAVFYICSS